MEFRPIVGGTRRTMQSSTFFCFLIQTRKKAHIQSFSVDDVIYNFDKFYSTTQNINAITEVNKNVKSAFLKLPRAPLLWRVEPDLGVTTLGCGTKL
jgi:hypothetical protein